MITYCRIDDNYYRIPDELQEQFQEPLKAYNKKNKSESGVWQQVIGDTGALLLNPLVGTVFLTNLVVNNASCISCSLDDTNEKIKDLRNKVLQANRLVDKSGENLVTPENSIELE